MPRTSPSSPASSWRQSLAQYRFQAAFASWLYRLVISCAQDWQRSQKRHDHDELHESVPRDDESQTEDQIYLLQVLGELDELGEGMKETALLVHAEGMSHAEAGAVLGVSESTISWRIHTIRRHMGKREATGERKRMNQTSLEKQLQQPAPSPDPAARLAARRAAVEEFDAVAGHAGAGAGR